MQRKPMANNGIGVGFRLYREKNLTILVIDLFTTTFLFNWRPSR